MALQEHEKRTEAAIKRSTEFAFDVLYEMKFEASSCVQRMMLHTLYH